ncbi:bifunctional diguanylate cyclase/phosphodiesterase [Reinekea sp.]|uniref:putative bifunctional diguanylate cyclase/phosphodiesterase n=1 Tax=Reinekea sp. TaxID=1970455 RepID=UPI002A7F752A|nr:bifunctional diguanylate cyclase/phosphodiesterase [Reinekea sp.]
MNSTALKLAIGGTILQAMVVAWYWHGGVPLQQLAVLALPILGLVILSWYLERGTSARLEASRQEALGANRELDNVRQGVNKDPLTGLNSRVYIKERLEELLEIAVKRNESCAVLYIDLDFFKEFNEVLGHSQGNKLLMMVGNRLKSIVKKGDLLGYQGGDEFVIILPRIADMMAAELVARRVINDMANTFELNERFLSVSASIGISIGPVDGAESETLIRRAESALKVSKGQGRKGFAFYSASFNQNATERLMIDQHLRGALQRGEFTIVYQAIVADQGKTLKGFEALIRWNNPELGQVSPADFIPVAEQIGLITEIGSWVLRESAEQLKAWQSKYNRAILMSINVSPRQFLDESILPGVKNVLKRTGLRPESLQLEVTEGLFLSASERILSSISLLKQLGVKLALDDFGTGFSSLSYLNQLPFDVLKIDKSFVDGVCINDKDRKMAQAIISIAHGLNMEVVVEGVETAQQIHLLRDMKADSIQGFYYSQPLAAQEAEARFLAKTDFTALNENIWDKL